VPKGTPVEIIATLNKAANEVLAEPMIKQRLSELGAITMAGTPEDFGKIIQAETEKWEKVVKFAGAKVE
jgi:tripartite-type tricarboxylate transporter receptor subunit TctC